MTLEPVQGRAVRLAILVLAVFGAGAVAYVIATTVPTRDSLYPKCVTYTLLGLHCPGCGTGRSVHFLLNGQPLTALQYNAFAPFFVPFVILAAFRALVGWAFQKPQQPRRLIRPFWLWLLSASLIVYTVARNIPAEPFNLLAPKEIEPVIPVTRP